ncbi:Peptidase family S41 [Paenimyroides ummariense]|uniref:Peptidase family S41 n=1 Tax=Paenimyroides ummariense TaxID=913024 RepID=A0A1I5CQY2_9FLAO|nr:Peptidase family S41 [Paenimyroides ummariense]
MKSFKTFLNDFFSTIKKNNIKNLVIDLRENGGGNSQLGDELLSYLISEPFTQYEKTLTKYSDTQKHFTKNLTDAEDKYRQNILEKKSGTVETTDKSNSLTFPKKLEQRFNGNVLILISGQTFSSAADFANACKYYKVGTTIGEETGGSVVSAGETIQIVLPHSKLQLNVSTSKDYNVGARTESRHGVKPHVKVSASKALDYAFKRIKKLEVSTN